MNRDDRLLATGSLAAVLGVGAGIAEILAGTVSWAGNKNDPTTLGWVTIGLAVVVGAVSRLAQRAHQPEAQLTATLLLVVGALVGFTTAGIAWVPAALAALAVCALVVRRPRGHRVWRTAVGAHWAPALVGVLAIVYLTFGIVARDRVGLLGVVGAVLAVAALAVHHRSRLLAALGLVVAAVPFAAATAWTVVTPLSAVLILVIGLPYVLDRSHTVSTRGGTS